MRLKSFIAGFLGALCAVLLTGTFYPEATFAGPPPGMMSYVDNANCPNGWAEFTAARGYAIVNLVASGTLATGVGTVLTNQESRTHTHTFAHTHSVTAGNINVSGSASSALARLAVDNMAWTDGAWKDHGVGGAVAFAANLGIGAVTTNSQSTSTTGASSAVEAPYLQLVLCSKS